MTNLISFAAKDIRIFLAEDYERDVVLVKEALGQMRCGYTLMLARNGEEALTLVNSLEEVKESDRSDVPDVFVLDLNLPHVSGIELLARIREVGRLQHIPIVIFTSSGSPRDRETALELGATRYVQKPTDLDTFMKLGSMIEELVGNNNR
jgi:chemotaxis family two-component system response regulator Rcp1